MRPLRTPGVYVDEVATLPPSVAEVSTAIPAFLGYTEKGSGVQKISSLLEYEEVFGRAKATAFTVSATLSDKNEVASVTVTPKDATAKRPQFLMYYCIAHYFKNGGGPCYVISVGTYSGGDMKKDDFEKAFPLLEQEDEPTLILLTDAVNLSLADYCSVCEEALKQCNKLKDRFLILDVPYNSSATLNKDAQDFRDSFTMSYLSYASAYYPYLETTLTLDVGAESTVEVTVTGGPTTAPAPSNTTTPPAEARTEHSLQFPTAGGGMTVSHSSANPPPATPKVTLVAGDAAQPVTFATATPPALTITNVSGRTGGDIVDAFTAWRQDSQNQTRGFSLTRESDGTAAVTATAAAGVDLTLVQDQPATSTVPLAAPGAGTLADYATTNTTLYNRIKSELGQLRVTLPPSAAIAGVYARVDRDRGVWKAPANESVFGLSGPVLKMTDEQQEGLNIDPTAGKSINAIRQFVGKGTLVWGARTLAGNDNEWRYVPVRRLFITIEESTKKASAFAVFEPNDATTWLKVKGMIESYLFSLWERGALAGAKPEAAYYVNVGLGKTMTAQDVLEGRLIVEIGVAAVRPAEFIVLRFMHKLQES